MKCLIGHEIKTDRGFRVFEAGQDYDASEVVGREKYFEKEAVVAAAAEEKPPEPETEKPLKKGRKFNEEVEK